MIRMTLWSYTTLTDSACPGRDPTPADRECNDVAGGFGGTRVRRRKGPGAYAVDRRAPRLLRAARTIGSMSTSSEIAR
jgi:hypothetical protein